MQWAAVLVLSASPSLSPGWAVPGKSHPFLQGCAWGEVGEQGLCWLLPALQREALAPAVELQGKLSCRFKGASF